MQYTWQVTQPERARLVRDALRGRMISGQAIVLYIFYLILLVLARLIGGSLILIPGVIFILLCVAGIAFIWHRQLRAAVRAEYPIGSTATSTVADGRFRLSNAVSSSETSLDQLGKPRRVGSVITFVPPGARLRRQAVPRILLPEDITSH